VVPTRWGICTSAASIPELAAADAHLRKDATGASTFFVRVSPAPPNCEPDHRSVLPLSPDYTLHRLVIGDGCAEVGLLDGGCGHG
jgi:hypothetical protein